jgi:tetratricopeptide (TPR) repeat protein
VPRPDKENIMVFGGDNPESYYDEGLTASMKGDVGQAIQFFERAIQLDRSFFSAYHQLGKCYARLGQPGKAIDLLRQVVAVKPRLLPVRVDLAYALLDLGRTEEARQIFSDVVAVKPDNARAQLGMALCAFHAGNWDLAVTLAQQAMSIGGGSFAAFYLLGRASRLAGFMEASAENFHRADALLEKSIETSPDQPEAYYLRGEIHWHAGEITKAFDFYQAADNRARPDEHYVAYGEHFTKMDILAKRGLCLQRMGQPDSARRVGEELLKLDPNHKIGQLLKGG